MQNQHMDWPAVQQAFLAAGFDLVGVTDCMPLTGARLARWLARGYAAGMEWIPKSLHRRVDPRRLLSGCRSIVVAAAAYQAAGITTTALHPGIALIAHYARGTDYHHVLFGRCREAVSRLQRNFGYPRKFRIAVDSAPILEPEIAARAGLGVIGRNSLLLTRNFGSCVLLAEVLMDACVNSTGQNPPPEPICLGCRECIRACPTRALTEDGMVDARRCIAYLTIEHRGSIPRNLRPLMGTHVLGCDMCQAACPANRERLTPRSPFLSPVGPEGFKPSFQELLRMTPGVFKARFRGTSVARTGYRRFMRNVCIATGNSGDRALKPLLEQFLRRNDGDPLLSEHAEWAIARLG